LEDEEGERWEEQGEELDGVADYLYSNQATGRI